jgi:predicted nucleic acid-binding protein
VSPGVRVTSERRKRIALDTNLFIYHLEGNPAHAASTASLFGKIEAGRLSAVASVLVLHEILAGVHKAGHSDEAPRYRDLLLAFPNLEFLPYDAHAASISADLRARYALRTPDAVHLATAIVAGADAFVTNDAALRRVREIRVKLPVERVP